MNKFLRLIVAFTGLLSVVSAFTVGPQVNSMRSVTSPMTTATMPFQQTQSSTSLSVMVDPAIADMMAKSDPFGAIFMLVLLVSFWELSTPGRAKKV